MYLALRVVVVVVSHPKPKPKEKSNATFGIDFPLFHYFIPEHRTDDVYAQLAKFNMHRLHGSI
jgi:hypothetical protein